MDCDRKGVLALPSGALHLWLCYYMNENSTQQAYLNLATIEKQTGLTDKTIIKWRDWMVERGWLVKTGETAADMYTKATRGAHQVMVYRVDDPAKQDCANLRKNAQDGRAADVQQTCTERALDVQSDEKPPTSGKIPALPAENFRTTGKSLEDKNSGQDSVSGSVSGLDYGSQLGVGLDSQSRSSTPSAAPQPQDDSFAPLSKPEPLNPNVNPNDRTNPMGGVAPQTPRRGDMVVLEVIDPSREVYPDFLTLNPETPCGDCKKPIGEYGCGAADHAKCIPFDHQWDWMRGKVTYRTVFYEEDDLNPLPGSAHPSPEESNAAALQALKDRFANHGKKKQFFADGSAYPDHWYRLTSDEKRQMVAQHRKPGKKRQRAAKV